MRRERNCSFFCHLSVLFSIFKISWPPQCSGGVSAVWKTHESPGCACNMEMLAWEAAPLWLHLLDALRSFDLMLMFKAIVSFHCLWQPDGDDMSFWSFSELALANLSPALAFDFSHFLYFKAFSHKHSNSATVHRVITTRWGCQTEI